jgi:hypothetical protein
MGELPEWIYDDEDKRPRLCECLDKSWTLFWDEQQELWNVRHSNGNLQLNADPPSKYRDTDWRTIEPKIPDRFCGSCEATFQAWDAEYLCPECKP